MHARKKGQGAKASGKLEVIILGGYERMRRKGVFVKRDAGSAGEQHCYDLALTNTSRLYVAYFSCSSHLSCARLYNLLKTALQMHVN